jgi:hypothetical protein
VTDLPSASYCENRYNLSDDICVLLLCGYKAVVRPNEAEIAHIKYTKGYIQFEGRRRELGTKEVEKGAQDSKKGGDVQSYRDA